MLRRKGHTSLAPILKLQTKAPAVIVLFVEDSAGDALLTSQILAEHVKPVKLVVARDGEQALLMLSDPTFEPALMIVDLNVPRVDGFEVLKRNPRKDIPAVVFSGSANPADVQRASERTRRLAPKKRAACSGPYLGGNQISIQLTISADSSYHQHDRLAIRPSTEMAVMPTQYAPSREALAFENGRSYIGAIALPPRTTAPGRESEGRRTRAGAS